MQSTGWRPSLTLDRADDPVVASRHAQRRHRAELRGFGRGPAGRRSREPVTFRFVPRTRRHTPDEEIELDADDCDEIEYAGSHFDLGEAVAQSLALAIDPFLDGPEAEEARRKVGLLGRSCQQARSLRWRNSRRIEADIPIRTGYRRPDRRQSRR